MKNTDKYTYLYLDEKIHRSKLRQGGVYLTDYGDIVLYCGKNDVNDRVFYKICDIIVRWRFIISKGATTISEEELVNAMKKVKHLLNSKIDIQRELSHEANSMAEDRIILKLYKYTPQELQNWVYKNTMFFNIRTDVDMIYALTKGRTKLRYTNVKENELIPGRVYVSNKYSVGSANELVNLVLYLGKSGNKHRWMKVTPIGMLLVNKEFNDVLSKAIYQSLKINSIEHTIKPKIVYNFSYKNNDLNNYNWNNYKNKYK